MLQTTTGGTASIIRTSPDDTVSSYCCTPNSDTTYEPSTNYPQSHDTPAVVTPAAKESPDSTEVPEIAEQVTTPVMTQQSSPAVESAHVSLEYSQPSTPEEDHMITKGFQAVCQVRISIFSNFSITILGAVIWSS